jgi:hypothetical protein
MLEITGLGVAFNPTDECIKEAADVIINGKDLSNILSAFESYI